MLIYLILELSFCSLKKNTNTNSIHKHVQEWSYIGRDGASLRPKFRGSSRFEADPRMTVDMQQNLGSVYDSIWFSCKPDTTTVILPFHFFWTYWHLLLQKTAPPRAKSPHPRNRTSGLSRTKDRLRMFVRNAAAILFLSQISMFLVTSCIVLSESFLYSSE